MATGPGGSCWSFCCCVAVLGVITLKPEATSMLSLFWVLLVVAQPTVRASRDMTLIILNESRTCFMILGSFQVALFLICHRRPLTARRPANSPLRFARSNAYLTRILPERSSAEQLDFGRTTPCPIVCGDPMPGRNVLLALLQKCRSAHSGMARAAATAALIDH